MLWLFNQWKYGPCVVKVQFPALFTVIVEQNCLSHENTYRIWLDISRNKAKQDKGKFERSSLTFIE